MGGRRDDIAGAIASRRGRPGGGVVKISSSFFSRLTITAFVMINIDTKTEYKVIDELFSRDEIQEVHSVHGTIDILVKIVLKRDFLASDAEIISEFVDQNIRRIEGINRTQTIIPGISKVKEGFMF
jgi:DNA-binding Lrp family transcriptional regulator